MQDTVGQLLMKYHQQNRLSWAQQHKATDWNQVIFADETAVRLISTKGLVWNFPGKKESFVLLSIQSRWMFGVVSQARISAASLVFGRTSTQNSYVISISTVSRQQLRNNLVTIQRCGSCKKTTIPNFPVKNVPKNTGGERVPEKLESFF